MLALCRAVISPQVVSLRSSVYQALCSIPRISCRILVQSRVPRIVLLFRLQVFSLPEVYAQAPCSWVFVAQYEGLCLTSRMLDCLDPEFFVLQVVDLR